MYKQILNNKQIKIQKLNQFSYKNKIYIGEYIDYQKTYSKWIRFNLLWWIHFVDEHLWRTWY